MPNPGGSNSGSPTTWTAVQPDGKVVALTTTAKPPVKGLITSEAILTRLNGNGSLDTTFGTGGTVLLPLGNSNYGMSLALEPDGKILVASQAWLNSSADTEYAVARVNVNGTLDKTFGGAGTGWWVSNPSSRPEAISHLSVVPQGSSFSIYAGGGAGLANGDLGVVVVKLTSAGVPDTSFGSGGFAIRDTGCTGSSPPVGYGSSEWGAVAVTSSGRVVVGGRLTVQIDSSTELQSALFAFTPSGQVDTGFNGNGAVLCSVPGTAPGKRPQMIAIAAQGDSILTAGWSIFPDGIVGGRLYTGAVVERYTPAGALDTTFATNGVYVGPYVAGSLYSQLHDLKVAPDGSIVITGRTYLTDSSGTTHYGLLVGHLLANGAPDANFGPNPDGSGLAILYDFVPPGAGGGAYLSLSLDPTSGNILIGSYFGSYSQHGQVWRFTGP